MLDQAQQLRVRVQAALAGTAVKHEAGNNGGRAYTFCVTSGKGGVGKTSFSVNFALALARCNKKVLLIDGDFGFSNVNILLGKNATYTLEHVVRREKKLEEVMEECYPNVWYISGGSGVSELIKLRDEQLEEIVEQMIALEQQVDYIIFDTGAGINDNIIKMIDASDQTILVMTPEPTSILDSFVVLKTVADLPERPMVSALVNKVTSEQEALSTYQNFSNVVHKHLLYDIELLGYITRDNRITQSITSMVPYLIQYPSSFTASQFQKIANAVTKTQTEEKARGLKHFLRRLIGRGEEAYGG